MVQCKEVWPIAKTKIFNLNYITGVRGVCGTNSKKTVQAREARYKLKCEHPLKHFVFAMARLRAGVHEIARGRIGC